MSMTASAAGPKVRTERTACILCSRNCGLVVDVDGGRLTKIRGDAEHPVSKGYLCQKAARLEHYAHHADRLRSPLRREPDGTFVEVSWDAALGDIARRLVDLRARHGGGAFAFVGGGGQGNHLGGAYGRQLLSVMKSRWAYNSLAQEKTGDFWVNGRLFGSQTCHTTEDVEHADYVLVIGANPFQSHGIPNARDTLRALRDDPARTLVVVDPRRTETARGADVHLQLRPGTDAFLLGAMLAIIVREGLHDRAFLAAHCTGFDEVERALREVPVEAWVRRADVPLDVVTQVARGFATARRACVRVDLGLQHTLHTTLNGYLEKLLYLVTGHFGREGCNNLHSFLLPILGDTDERKTKKGRSLQRTAHHGVLPIGGIYPPNILADEIEHPGEDRLRAVFVDSSNPALTYADTTALERAFRSLELLVVVDVAMTETARLAHYVLPASSQFEKWEATGFNLEFPENAFHLRHPVLPPAEGTLAEPEIYTRLLEQMGAIPRELPWLAAVARHEPAASAHAAFLGVFGMTMARRRSWFPLAASILYRTLGPTLDGGAAAAAPLLPLCIAYASKHRGAVLRAGYRGNRLTLGVALFRAILRRRSGALLSRHVFDDTWRLLRNADRRVHLAVPEMLAELRALRDEAPPGTDYPFILMAGERRTYNANQIYRDPAWRRNDPDGAMRMHPDDATSIGVIDGATVRCTSATGAIDAVVSIDDTVRRGVVTLPHGYGMRYADGGVIGPAINVLTARAHCDPRTRTPYHKYVPVRLAPC